MALMRIKYKGLSDVRAITKKDAERHGVKLSEDLVWDHVGGHAGGQVVPGIKRPDFPNASRGIVVDGLSEELLDVLKKEGTFTVTEIKDDGTDGDNVITGEPLDDTGSTVVDTTTGQTTSAGEANADADPVPTGSEAGGTTPTGRTGKGRST